MKHPRLILWYTTIVPMTIMYIVIAIVSGLIGFVNAHRRALHEVLDNVLMRYEMWAKYNKKGTLLNCPWKYTLKQVYKNALREDY